MTRRVVITGVGVVSSIGVDFEGFSHNLMSGASGVEELRGIFGAELDDVEPRFGAPLGGALSALVPSELESHRSLAFAVEAIRQVVDQNLEVAWATVLLRCGVGIGQQLPEVAELGKGGARAWRDDLVAFLAAPGSDAVVPRLAADFGTNLLRKKFGFAPCPNTFAGACSAATHACIQAIEDVALGEDLAVAGAHDSMLSTLGLYVMHGLGTLATCDSHGYCKVRPFDVNREGTLIGEGAAYFLFEEMQHAQAREACIFAEVKGYGTSLDGYHVTSPDPSGDAGVRMIQAALAKAKLSPDQIDYVNAHGTGTIANDPIEAGILKRVFGEHRPYVSSSKPQFGHLVAACGAIELLGCIAAVTRQELPPNINCGTQDPECDVLLSGPIGRSARIQNVLCNSFGFGGQNSCLIIGAFDGCSAS